MYYVGACYFLIFSFLPTSGFLCCSTRQYITRNDPEFYFRLILPMVLFHQWTFRFHLPQLTESLLFLKIFPTVQIFIWKGVSTTVTLIYAIPYFKIHYPYIQWITFTVYQSGRVCDITFIIRYSDYQYSERASLTFYHRHILTYVSHPTSERKGFK